MPIRTYQGITPKLGNGVFIDPMAVVIGDVTIDEDTLDGAPHFTGRLIRGVKNGPSPQWLQDQLKAIGLRPISALVDITNYMTFDSNRPLHGQLSVETYRRWHTGHGEHQDQHHKCQPGAALV